MYAMIPFMGNDINETNANDGVPHVDDRIPLGKIH